MKLRIDNELLVDMDTGVEEYVSGVVAPQQQQNGIQNVHEPTELGEAIRELNDDTVTHGKMSGIDLRSDLHPIEISAILAVDTLVSLQFLPQSCLPFTRQKKRLSVSKMGKGRQNIVDIVGGKRSVEERVGGGSIASRIGGMFGGRKEQ